jgi:hypothetical protein
MKAQRASDVSFEDFVPTAFPASAVERYTLAAAKSPAQPCGNDITPL